MKRSKRWFIILSVLIAVFLTGCFRGQREDNIIVKEFEPDEIHYELNLISGLNGSYDVEVFVDRDTVKKIATVYAWTENDDTLYLKFEAIEGWKLLESRVATSVTLSGFPKNERGQTDPSLFSGEIHLMPLDNYTIQMDLGKLEDNQRVYFAYYLELREVGTRTRVKYGICINSLVYHDDNPVIDKKPKLEGDIDDPLVRGFTYDWEIEKSVDPESVELKLGESATLTYTINATRTPVEGDFALSGAVNLNSTGELPASSIAITVMLQYLLGDVYTDLEGFTAINVDTSATPTLNPGESSSYKYDFAFDPKEGVDEYRIRASITADDLFPFTLDATFTLSGLAESTDATATIADQLKDIQSEIPGGFSAAYMLPTTGNWILEQPGDGTQTFSIVYEVLLTNEKIENPQQDFYILDNTATLTEYDSKTEHSDDARVIITVPQPFIDNPDLKIENEHDMEWDQEKAYSWEKDTNKDYDSDDEEVKIIVPEDSDLKIENEHDMEWDQEKAYSWEIEKSATPESIELKEGEDGTFTYTLLATRTVKETNIATLTGLATVTNTGNVDLTNIAVEIILKDADGVEIDKYTTTIAALAVGLQEGLPYSFTFDPTGYKAPFKVIAKATDGASDEVETEQLLPTPKVTEIDKDAYVKDTFDAFGVTGIAIEGNIDRDWLDIIEGTDWNSLTSSWSVSYTVVATNTGAAPGEYPLDNTVVIYGEDTNKDYDSDDEEVKIIVPETVKLEAEVAAEFFWIREKIYEWEIDKKANPTQITFLVNEFEKDIEYTITATKTLKSEVDTHSYSGSVKVTNNGNSEAQNVKLTITLQYYDGSDWITIQTLPEVELGSISSGGDNTYGFGPIAFTPVDNTAEHRVKVEVSADAPANTDEAYDDSFLSITGTTETNATAVLDDEFTYVPDGFAIVATDPDPLPFPMNLTDSAVVQFSITIRKFSFGGSGTVTYEYPVTDAYISATVTGYMAGTYPGWCIQVNVPGIGGPYTIQDVYNGGAPDSKMAKANYILNRYRDELYPDGVDYRHIQIAIWAIMEGSLNWNSWRKMFDPNVPDGDRPLVQAIIDTAKEDFLPGCGDVVLIKALSADKQDVILEITFPCEEEEFRLKNTATLTSDLQKIWDDAVVKIKLTPTDPETWGKETAWGGNYEGDGASWWYYFDTNGPATQDIYAGQNKVAGASVTYKDGKLTIVLGPNMRLQSGSETVKIQGYAEDKLPTERPAGGQFTYKGTDLVVPVSPARYFAIHLDVEVLK